MKILYILSLVLLTTMAHGQDTAYICPPEDLAIASLENLNTRSIEFSPVYYQEGLVYVVARENNRIIDPSTGRAYFDLMYVDIGPEGVVSKNVSFSPTIRTQYHEGPCTFNHDETELFFTRSNVTAGQSIQDENKRVQLKIYSASKGPDDWENITALPFCGDDYSVAHPALSQDGNHLVFTSDMPGGYGGMDLYKVNRENGLWSAPINLGGTINTTGNEVFPFWHPDDYLLFSSDGHKGMGGLDLYITAWDLDSAFIGLQHLDAPFNSKKDDLSLIISDDGRSGYFASDRKPTEGKDDLYRWSSSRSIFCRPADKLIPHEILVVDEKGDVVRNSYAWLIPMDKQGPQMHQDHFSIEVNTDPDEEDDFQWKWLLKDTLSSKTANAFSDSQGKLMVHANQNLNYGIVVQHEGHQPYFEVFWQKPIPTVITLQSLPPASAPCVSTLFSVYNEKGDTALNGARIKLVSSCFNEPRVFYTKENGTALECLVKGCAMKAEVVQEGYVQHTFSFTPVEADEHWKIYLEIGESSAYPAAPIASGTVIVLDNIYYDFNKSAIRKGDAGELSALANILRQYPDLTIELTSHTDTRGTAEYNMELSERRSESSKEYLVLLGIDESRIITKAAGETTPRNKCLDNVSCTEAEHQFNRRTEVRIINPRQGMEIKYKSEG